MLKGVEPSVESAGGRVTDGLKGVVGDRMAFGDEHPTDSMVCLHRIAEFASK